MAFDPRRAMRKTFGLAMRVARVSVYFAFVAAVGLVLVVRSVHGRARKLAVELGEDLTQLTEIAPDGAPYELRLNGEAVNVASATTPLPLHAVLDRFQKACEEHADGLDSAFANLKLATAPDAPPIDRGFPGVGLMRSEEADKRGVMVCFAQGAATSQTDIVRRLTDFAKSGDLSRFGQVRYVAAKATKSGGTHVVAVWTSTSFKLDVMFPEKGDAPGSDVTELPRLPESRRLLTAYAEGAPYAIRVYETARSPQEVLTYFTNEAPKKGWTLQPLRTEDPSKAVVFERGGVDLMVFAQVEGGMTSVSMVEMGAEQK